MRWVVRFTKEQLSVITAPEKKVIVSASAGTGKTATLIGAANEFMKEKDSRLAVITLTNAAADELKERMTVLPVFVGTIHSFALRELEKISESKLYIHSIMTEKKMKEVLLTSYIHFYDVRRNYKEEINNIFRFLTDKDYQPKESSKYQRVIKKYTQIKKERGLYDFMDAPEYLLEVLGKIKYKLDFTHLLVDEIQDIDKYEFDLINKFDCRVMVIGDPRQTIFQFRNSFYGVFDKFRNLGYNLYVLTKNFRSFQEILDFADSGLEAVKGSGGVITDSILLEVNPESTVLCRYNREVNILSSFFPNVHTVHSYKGLEEDDIVIINFSTSNEEGQNIMFVAKTRARNRLGMSSLDEAIRIGEKIKYGL